MSYFSELDIISPRGSAAMERDRDTFGMYRAIPDPDDNVARDPIICPCCHGSGRDWGFDAAGRTVEMTCPICLGAGDVDNSQIEGEGDEPLAA